MPTPQEALAAFFAAPGIKNSTANLTGRSPRELQRMSDIYSGVDSMVPSDDSAEVRQAQDALTTQQGAITSIPSRESVRESGLAKVRAMLKLQQAEDAQQQALARTKGEYDVKAQTAGAQAAMDRVLAQQAGQNERVQMQQGGMNTRNEADNAAAQQKLAAQAKVASQKQMTQGIKAINAQIAKMEADAVKNRPNALVRRFMGDPRGDAVNTAKQARDLAMDIARNYPDMDTEDALAQLGVTDATPDELGQVNAFLGMLRGQ
jgi:hypothetical protein